MPAGACWCLPVPAGAVPDSASGSRTSSSSRLAGMPTKSPSQSLHLGLSRLAPVKHLHPSEHKHPSVIAGKGRWDLGTARWVVIFSFHIKEPLMAHMNDHVCVRFWSHQSLYCPSAESSGTSPRATREECVVFSYVSSHRNSGSTAHL